MQASPKLRIKTLLSPLAIALVLITPHAFAKKDLFANDPGAKQTQHAEQLVPNASSSSAPAEKAKEETPVAPPKMEEKAKAPAPEAKNDTESGKKSSYLETQFARLKGHLVDAKDDLFGGKKTAKKESASAAQQTLADSAEGAHSSEDAQPEAPTISATEAAQRAQTLAEGQVINVRKYQEDDKPRYAVKLLQKNGRMKTINLDAVSGTLIEEKPVEETPQ